MKIGKQQVVQVGRRMQKGEHKQLHEKREDGGRQVRQDGDNTPNLWFSTRGRYLPSGHLTMCEDTSDRHNWEMLLHLESDRDAAQHPLKPRKSHNPTAPARKKLSAPKVPTAEVGKPAVVHEHRICPCVDFVP